MNNVLNPQNIMSFFFLKLYYFLKKYPKTCQLYTCVFSKIMWKLLSLFNCHIFYWGCKFWKIFWIIVFNIHKNFKKSRKSENVNFSHLVPFCQSLSQLYIYKALKMAIDIVKFSGQSVFYSGPKKKKLHE